MPLDFYRFSTAGNTSLFTWEPCNFAQALKAVPAEQAGWVDRNQAALQMGGGELCINASLAAAALLHMEGLTTAAIHTNGLQFPCDVKGASPNWHVTLWVKNLAALAKRSELTLVTWPGITHALVQTDALPAHAEALKRATARINSLNLPETAALGIVWWRAASHGLEIRPVVHVPALDTFFLEEACGSASLSLGVVAGKGRHVITQVSGQKILVENTDTNLKITAPVRLLAQGQLWQ